MIVLYVKYNVSKVTKIAKIVNKVETGNKLLKTAKCALAVSIAVAKLLSSETLSNKRNGEVIDTTTKYIIKRSAFVIIVAYFLPFYITISQTQTKATMLNRLL